MTSSRSKRRAILIGIAIYIGLVACMTGGSRAVPQHRWWSGLGPVVPHDDFPSDCKLCHVGDGWQTMREDFAYDHQAETGVPLVGAHGQAQCLRCHNDRAPVDVMAARGCAGCHEDVHRGTLGVRCDTCHGETNWRPEGQVERHRSTRFPLVGVHAITSCRRCHVGAEVGSFMPTPVQCVSCHADDLARAVNPPHAVLGWVNRCDRCHMPTTWNQAELDASFQ